MHFISMKLSGTSDAYGQMWTDNPGIDTYNVKYTDCITNAFMSTDGRYGEYPKVCVNLQTDVR